ncbi:hypothetical protein J5N97_021178 [Dioscorea zingiberensis]|uniref:Uncharacterized protein n=1 Tax=Dioscorea zingiberensis TaxID=325984 RepID=A0A9D5HE25_9LILI|nr:hypothetical protein J5N97_021178 [Dioscorea zingiberensis]
MKETPPPFPSTPSPPDRRPLRRRTRSTGSSTSSLSSSSLSPSPSPLPHLSSIPFSWEHLPGVPKIPRIPSSHPNLLLPLPPLLKPSPDPPRRKKPDPTIPIPDPFAAALAECAKDSPAPSSGPADLEDFWRRGAALTRRRVLSAVISSRFGLPDLYASCKTACSVSDSTIRIPRSSSLTRRSA